MQHQVGLTRVERRWPAAPRAVGQSCSARRLRRAHHGLDRRVDHPVPRPTPPPMPCGWPAPTSGLGGGQDRWRLEGTRRPTIRACHRVWCAAGHPASAGRPAPQCRRHVQHRPGEPEIPPNTGNVIGWPRTPAARCTWWSRWGSRWGQAVAARWPGLPRVGGCAARRRMVSAGRTLPEPDPTRCFAFTTHGSVAFPARSGSVAATGSSSAADRGSGRAARQAPIEPAIACACRCGRRRSLNLNNAVAVVVFEAWRPVRLRGRAG